MAEKKKFKYVPFMTGRMVLRFPKLSKPDVGGEYSDGKYKSEAFYESETDTAKFKKEIEAAAKQAFPELSDKEFKKLHFPWKTVTRSKDDDEEIEVFSFKSPKKKPLLQDAKNKAIPKDAVISGGSEGRFAGVIAAWEKGSKRGVSLWPDAVRVLKLVEGGFQGFGAEEDGFDAEDRPSQSNDDEEDNSNEDGSDDDTEL